MGSVWIYFYFFLDEKGSHAVAVLFNCEQTLFEGALFASESVLI